MQSGVCEMATVPGQLIWEIVKKNNSFLVKEFGNGTQSVVFSKESNNLYNLNSYKHSGNHHLIYLGINCLFYLRIVPASLIQFMR